MPATSPITTSLDDQELTSVFAQEKARLEQTQIPIVTVSASFKEDLKKEFGLPDDETLPDVVLSRAHYSMAVALATQAWGEKVDERKAWVVDPTNYVSASGWRNIEFTEFVGRTLARHQLLKIVKDFVDRFGRNKLPILKSISPSLLYLTKNIDQPILSLHIAAGNLLIEAGKTVVQVITDPHVRYDYLQHAESPRMYFCVFDEKTRTDLLEKAAFMNKRVDPARVIVTGSPVDPRILAVRSRKRVWRKGPLRLCITTGGLGTNKPEIETLLHQLMPTLRQRNLPWQVIVYAGTNADIYQAVMEMAQLYRIKVGASGDSTANLRVFYHPQIVNANELLLHHAFPWADGFITKPSGDMTYDAAAAGCFVLSMKEWGEWETNIRQVFEQRGVSRMAQTHHILAQLQALSQPQTPDPAWITQAMLRAQNLSGDFSRGSANILRTYRDVKRQTEALG